jgi:hypothetical protein
MLKFVKPYSMYCNHVNKNPYEQATQIASNASSLIPAKMARCAQIVATPEDNRITVLANGR